MPGGRAYDYSAPFFGGFTCQPPAMNTTRSDRADAFASSRADSLRRSEFASNSRQSSFSRSDSLKSNRQDSLTRPPLTRMDTLTRSTTNSTSEYSIGGGSRPSYSTTTTSYTSPSPYTNNYRTSSKY